MSKKGNSELVKERDVFFQKILEQPMDDVVGLLERIANLETFGCFTCLLYTSPSPRDRG